VTSYERCIYSKSFALEEAITLKETRFARDLVSGVGRSKSSQPRASKPTTDVAVEKGHGTRCCNFCQDWVLDLLDILRDFGKLHTSSFCKREGGGGYTIYLDELLFAMIIVCIIVV